MRDIQNTDNQHREGVITPTQYMNFKTIIDLYLNWLNNTVLEWLEFANKKMAEKAVSVYN